MQISSWTKYFAVALAEIENPCGILLDLICLFWVAGVENYGGRTIVVTQRW